jgi:hypothetical protein
VLFVIGLCKLAQRMKISDSEVGVRVRPDSRYNQVAGFPGNSLGVDVLTVVAETTPNACTENYDVMETMDRFAHGTWPNVEGDAKVITLPMVKVVNSGWNEGVSSGEFTAGPLLAPGLG